MENIAIINGSFVVHYNYLIAIIGILAGLFLSLALAKPRRCRKKCILIWFPIALVLSILFARFFHWYFHSELYPSFINAMTNYSFFNGTVEFHDGYNIVGLLFGSLLAARILQWCKLIKSRFVLLDTIVPGLLLTVALIRISHLFIKVCRGKIQINSPFFQRLPFAEANEAAGVSYYMFATFFISAILFFIAAIVFTVISVRHAPLPYGRKSLQWAPGKLAFLGLTLGCGIEIVLDSTRQDCSLLNFKLVDFLNKALGFISVVMVVSCICMIVSLIHFIKIRKRAHLGFVGQMILFIVGLIILGVFEYLGQRYTNMSGLFHWIQALGSALMVISIFLLSKKK